MNDFKDLRASERIPISSQVQVRFLGKMATCALAVNISMGGLLLSAAPPMPIGSACELAIHLPGDLGGKLVLARGTVVRSDQQETAIRFADNLRKSAYDAFAHPQSLMAGNTMLKSYIDYFRVSQSRSRSQCELLLGVSRSTFKRVFLTTFCTCIPLSVLPVWLLRNSIPPAADWLKILLAFCYALIWIAIIQPIVDLIVLKFLGRKGVGGGKQKADEANPPRHRLKGPLPVGTIQFRFMGLLAVAALCSSIACSGGSGGGSGPGTASQTVTSTIDAVSVTPATVILNADTQHQFTATVTGTGSFITGVTWSAQRGTITNGGLYTAPPTGGNDVVTVASVQDPNKTATASVTVNPVTGQGAPIAPILSGPTEVQALSGPYSATMALDSGLDAQWSITGGILVSANNGSTIQFQAGSAPILTLRGTVSNGVGSATSDRKIVALPFVPRNYPSDLKANLATYRGVITSEVATGDVNIYSATTYYLMGLASGAEATGDTALMDELVGYIGQMIALAKPLVRNGVTYQQWGPFDANGNPNQAYTFMSAEPLARTAAIIASRPEFKARYGAKADQMVAFVDQSIFKYWFDKTTGVYAAPNSPWPAGQIPWLSTELGGWGSYAYWANQCTHLGLIATWMYQATRNPLYLDAATRVGKGFKTYLVATNGHWIWNQGKMGWDPDNLAGSPDTSHANREPMMMVSMYEAGIVFSAADVDMMAHTFVDVIWNQSETDPMFSNYIDGTNLAYRTATAPGSNGLIYHGWDALGRYSPEAQRVLALSNQIIRTRNPLNVSLSNNASSYGRVLLSGTLARNTAR